MRLSGTALSGVVGSEMRCVVVVIGLCVGLTSVALILDPDTR